MTKDEATARSAMKLALEALEAGEYYIDDLEAIVYAADDLGTHEDRAKMQEAITALREALASEAIEQPAQQEPVAWVCEGSEPDEKHGIDYWPGDVDDLPIGTQLYTSPPTLSLAQRQARSADTWVGLTDEEIDETHETKVWDARRSYARAIEAKLKEKNT